MGAAQTQKIRDRYARLRAIGCVCCRLNLLGGLQATGQGTEIHHLNENGQPGQARRGDGFTIPLCIWHHRGVGYRSDVQMYGPSWARGTRPFREVYGSDDDLLGFANRLIEHSEVTA